MQKRFDSVFRDLLIDAGLCAGDTGSEPKLLVGVSGGVDSMCLARLILHSSVPVQMAVAHCNFHLRGEESDGDEAFVSGWCVSNGVEFCKTDFDTVGYAGRNGLSVEIAARELRYDWFGRLCRERGFDALVVAHNANDNAETLFLNLLRGTGLRGLCGMRPLSVVPVVGSAGAGHAYEPICGAASELAPAGGATIAPGTAAAGPNAEPAPDGGAAFAPGTAAAGPNAEPAPDGGAAFAPESRHIPLLRPLLTFTRDQIEAHARENGIHWREDSTNAVNDCHRNILRNEVFPLLAEINPSFVRTLNREMQYFTDADDLVEAVVPDLIQDGKIDIEELLSYGHWQIFLFNLLRPFNFNSAVIDDIAGHLASDTPNSIFHSPTHRLQITSRSLLISELTAAEKIETYIYKGGTYKIDGEALREVTQECPNLAIEVGARGCGGNSFKAPAAGAGTMGDTFAGECGTINKGRTINIEIIPREALTDLKVPRGTTCLDADKVGFPFMIRGWRHGDWFRPLGMGGAMKKVSDLFVDLKYSVVDKEAALFLTLPVDTASPAVNATPPRTADDGKPVQTAPPESSHILALLGERIDDAVKISSSTRKVLRITII